MSTFKKYTLAASALDFFYSNGSLKFTYIDDMILIFYSLLLDG